MGQPGSNSRHKHSLRQIQGIQLPSHFQGIQTRCIGSQCNSIRSHGPSSSGFKIGSQFPSEVRFRFHFRVLCSISRLLRPLDLDQFSLFFSLIHACMKIYARFFSFLFSGLPNRLSLLQMLCLWYVVVFFVFSLVIFYLFYGMFGNLL